MCTSCLAILKWLIFPERSMKRGLEGEKEPDDLGKLVIRHEGLLTSAWPLLILIIVSN